jgi:bifunctional non-homologous end joining protein LigD
MASPVDPGDRVVVRKNVEKVLYPETGFTKGELIDFYEAVGPVLVPHLAGRALTMRRFPDGVEGISFFEKRIPKHAPDWMATVEVVPHRAAPYRACSVEDVPTLVWLAAMAAGELHPSLALAAEPDRPTVLVFDLDPGPPAGVIECARVAWWLRELLGHLGLEGFAKTSGSKGLQVYVPLHSQVDFTTTSALAHSVARLLEQEHPELVVSTMAKTVREGRVFIDWSQNSRSKTTVSVYSVRARPRPTVSTPLHWEEIESVLSGRKPKAPVLEFLPADVLARVDTDGDLFGPVTSLVQQIPAHLVPG